MVRAGATRAIAVDEDLLCPPCSKNEYCKPRQFTVAEMRVLMEGIRLRSGDGR